MTTGWRFLRALLAEFSAPTGDAEGDHFVLENEDARGVVRPIVGGAITGLIDKQSGVFFLELVTAEAAGYG